MLVHERGERARQRLGLVRRLEVHGADDSLARRERARPSGGDTREVRATEQLDWTTLARVPARAAAEHATFPASISRARWRSRSFPGGHSNLTYLVRFGGAELVLRRPPLGPVPPKAHDMAREYRWLAALHPVFPLAPRPYLLCEDPSVVGSIFYVMERRRGIVVRHEEPLGPGESAGSAPAGQRSARRHARRSARGRRHAARRSRRSASRRGSWSVRCAAGPSAGSGRRSRSVPEMDALADWLVAHLPPDPDRPAVVHGDFKLDNVLLDPARPRRASSPSSTGR